MQGCPLGVRHLFCLFDGHGGDSVAEYCRTHLADQIIRRVREAHAARSAAAAAPSNDGPDANKSGRRSGSRRAGDAGAGGAAGEPGLVAGCVREACREVDAQVRMINQADLISSSS